MNNFARWLLFYRNRTKDDQNRSKPLTQERLADLIGYAPSTISMWESDSRVPATRDTIIDIIKHFIQYQGIVTPTEANHLLEAAGYGVLTEEEVQKFFPNWQADSTEPGSTDDPSTASGTTNTTVNNTQINNNTVNNTTVNNTEINNNNTVNNTSNTVVFHHRQRPSAAQFNLFDFLKHLFYVEPRENTSQLSAVIIHWLRLLKLPDIISMNLIGFITLSAFYTWGWACFLQWPSTNATTALICCVIFALCSLITPVLLGLSMSSDNQKEMEAALGRDTHIKFVRIMAIMLMNFSVQTVIFTVTTLLYLIGVWPIHYIVIIFLALINMLLMFAVGRDWPYRYFTWTYKRSNDPNEMNLIKTFGFLAILIPLVSPTLLPALAYIQSGIVRDTPQVIPLLFAIILLFVGIIVGLEAKDPNRHLLVFFQIVLFLVASGISLWILVQGHNPHNPFLAITCLLLTAIFVLSLGQITNQDDAFFNLMILCFIVFIIGGMMLLVSIVLLKYFGGWGYIITILPFLILYIFLKKLLLMEFPFMIMAVVLVWIATFALLALPIPPIWKNSVYALFATALVVWQIWRNRRARRALLATPPPPDDPSPAAPAA